MGVRRLALLAVLAGCPAKPAPPPPVPPPSDSPAPATAAPAAPTGDASPATPAPATTKGPASNATLAEVGIEATSLDRSADPCVDFYQFACGGWLRANTIPAHEAAWSRASEVAQAHAKALHAIAEEASSKPGDPVGDLYASCMDEAAIEKAALAPIKPLLAKTQGVKNARTWFTALTELHVAGVPVVWSLEAVAGLDDASRYVAALERPQLGLPDRDYYVNADRAASVAGYREHVQRMLALASVAKPEAAAADVVAIETALATKLKPAAERRDVEKARTPMDVKALAKAARSLDWKAYFKALGVTPRTVNVSEPAYLAALDGLRTQYKPAQWASYFTYHLLAHLAATDALPAAFGSELFARDALVYGMTERASRSARCVSAVAHWLPDLVGQRYVEKQVPAATKADVQVLFDALVKALGTQLAAVDWLSEPTRAAAAAKLAKIGAVLVAPDAWRRHDVAIERDDFTGNVLRASTAEARRTRAQIGKPYERAARFRAAFEVDASYDAAANVALVRAGLLQRPYFANDRAIAANMGALGWVIGHELTHGFDDQGAKYGASGALESWWTREDATRFATKATCVAEQYAAFEVLPKQFIDGALTVGENIADMGGIEVAFDAYRALRKDAAQPLVADGFSEDQVFFLAAAQTLCSKIRPAELQRRLTADPYSPPTFRVYGALRNLPAFAQAFSCAAGTPMRPARTCSVW